MSVDSSLWAYRVHNASLASITQRASRVTRYVTPLREDLAQISEARFNALMRDAFQKGSQV